MATAAAPSGAGDYLDAITVATATARSVCAVYQGRDNVAWHVRRIARLVLLAMGVSPDDLAGALAFVMEVVLPARR